MTDEQINAAISKACGRRQKPNGEWFPDNGLTVGSQGIPDYCNDLNAMHEAEKTIYKHNNLWTAYYYAIGAGPFSLHATARKKAEAFLRTLGKWEEVQG